MPDTHTSGGGRIDTPNEQPGRIPMRVWVVWVAVIGAIVVLTVLKFKMNSSTETLTQHRFEELVDLGRIVRGTVIYDPQNALNEVVGTYSKVQDSGTIEVPFRTRVRLTGNLERKLFSLPQFEARQANKVLSSVLWSILPFVVIGIFIWFFFIRQIKIAAANAPPSVDPLPKTLEQQARFEKILDKWEEQARRMDSVLDRMERDPRE